MLELNTITCGDCLDLMKDIPDGSIDAVVTDPPYFVPVNISVARRDRQYKKSYGDLTPLICFYNIVFAEIERVISSTGTIYMFCDAKSYPLLFRPLFEIAKHTRLVVWDKIVSYNGYTWRHQHELIAWGEMPDAVRIPTGDGDIIKCRGVKQEDKQHDAEKPVALIQQLISKHECDTILDPFLGSGTTAVAALRTGRNFIGIEIDPKYCEIAQKRVDAELAQTRLEI